MSLQPCKDTAEAVEFCERYNLYLKPAWKIKISVQLPVLKCSGQTISSWKVMEKLRSMIKPDEFVSLKVAKTNLVLIQFEAEVENKNAFKRVLQKLQTNWMKLSGFPDVLKIRAAEAKLNYPTRHDWDSFFRDAKNVDEMKPGERPDTIFIQNLPKKWFVEKNSSGDNPGEYVLRKVFETFGEVRRVAIPTSQDTSDQVFAKVRTFNRELVFDAYVQYKEYISFVKAMDSLKGMKLLLSESGKSYVAEIKVDFDRTRYLSDRMIKQRLVEEKHRQSQKRAEQTLRETPEVTLLKVSESDEKHKLAFIKQSSTSEKPSTAELQPENLQQQQSSGIKEFVVEKHLSYPVKQKRLLPKPLKVKESHLQKLKAAREEEAKHLFKELLHRAEETEMTQRAKIREQQIAEERFLQQKLLERAQEEERKRKEEAARLKHKYLQEQECKLREKLLKSLKLREQRKTEELREKLRKEIAGRKVLKSVLVMVNKSKSDDFYSPSKKFKS